eukprot:TRINITY_DN23074_c0_g1_i1.p1 TRINITY_DN23074_c0_g1~~TRINITY_DN23074_c0_g1_i1.p1  ORF type:complete len:348 (+),score=32.13 TRINITY_DN23074_c0_g1_i1:85-1128(+)
MSIEIRPLGSQGLQAAMQGLGAMGMTTHPLAAGETYGSREDEALRTITRYVELCGNRNALIDTAWIYQRDSHFNEDIVGKAVQKLGRDKFVLCTKFGIGAMSAASKQQTLDAKPATIRRQLSESLARLGTDYIDLYYQHRQDPDTPIEEVAATLKELVAEGKIRYVGYSEITADELRRAHAVHPVTAIQMEWSLQTRDLETDVVPTARELGVAIVPYSPLGRGMLAGRFEKIDDLMPGDSRLSFPRFSKENFDENAAAAAALAEIAARKKCTPAQLALAWVHAQGRDVFPIPGTKTVKRLEENVAAASIVLSPEECAEIEQAVPTPKGNRSGFMQSTYLARLNKANV